MSRWIFTVIKSLIITFAFIPPLVAALAPLLKPLDPPWWYFSALGAALFFIFNAIMEKLENND